MNSFQKEAYSSQLAAEIFRNQYIVLMLIIISFVVGAFTGGELVDPVPSTITPPKIIVPPKNLSKEIGSITYPGLFKSNSTEFNQEVADALASVLSQHEIGATFHLSIGTNEHLAMLRFARLFEYFSEKKVPLPSLQVVVEASMNPDEARINFEIDPG